MQRLPTGIIWNGVHMTPRAVPSPRVCTVDSGDGGASVASEFLTFSPGNKHVVSFVDT